MLPTRSSFTPNASTRAEIKNTSIYTFSAVITRLGNLILIPLYWQKLALTDYGIISITEILAAFLGVYLGLSLDASISRFYYEWPEQERKIRLGTLWITSWISSLILGGISVYLFYIGSTILFPDVQFFPYIFLGITYAILGRLDFIVYTTIRIKQMPRLYFAYSLCSFLIQALASIYFVMFLDWKAFGYLVALNLSEALIVALGILVMCRFAKPGFHKLTLMEGLRFSVPLIPNAFLGNVSSLMDRFLLQRFASLEILGVYAISVKFVNLIPVLHDAIKMSYAPFVFRIVSEKTEEAAEIIGKARLFYLIPILIGSIAISSYTGDFVKIINQEQYFQVVQYIPLLVGPALLDSLYAYYGIGLLLAKRTDLMWLPTTLRLLCIVVGGLLLIPWLQIDGVILSRYLAVIPFIGFSLLLSQKYYPIPFYWHKVLLIVLAESVALILSAIISVDNIFVSIIWHTILTVGTGLVILVIIFGFARISQLGSEKLRAKLFL